MAGTNSERVMLAEGPAIILVEPQLGENIGMVARAMANFGLVELRLVNPRDGWPSDKARAAASKADHVIDGTVVYDTLEEAIADLHFVYATTARSRDGFKPVRSPVTAAETLRANYYGAEVMRLQRGRHEVKLMVRYPEQERRSLANFEDIWIRTSDGQERPIREVATWEVVRGYSEINRLEQKRSITVSGDLDEEKGNAREIVSDLRDNFMPSLLSKYEMVSVRWEGQQEQTQESVASLLTATAVAMLVMFVLLTLEFKSYVQPLLIMFIIPFGLIGAIFGHAFMGLPITLFSFFGLVALTGVVVNDSIVLIDFINHRVRRGVDLDEALIDAGQRRFRPVLLTSATTIAGLLPILLEKSFQAQLLIPMATSLSFGLLLTTVLVLLLMPTTYRIYRHWIPVAEEEVEDEPVVIGAEPVPA